ncbi:hypothetical protein T08_11777 [Trichinella sp. T8]|nr:hypothetical protein T08_11777 [Trichinella sp. T8]
MDGTFKIVLEWYQQLFTIHKVADLGLRTRYLHEAETKKKIKMFVATTFLLLPEVLDVMDLLGTDVTGLLAAFFYELICLLIDVQGSKETLIQQATSGRVTANDLRVKNNKYEEVQLRITARTAEYDGGTRTMEQFLRAVANEYFGDLQVSSISPNIW